MLSRRCLPLPLLLFSVLLLYPTFIEGGESCCKHKLLLGQQAQESQPQWIPDPNDVPPLIDKPDDVRPADWDDEDDGEWAPAQIQDPHHQRRLIPNPLYVAPPTFGAKLKTEVWAALPWVTLGVVITGVLACLSLDRQLPKLLSSDRNLVLAALLGLATPLCSCGALPLCVGLVQSGVALPQVLAFLTASQSAGLDSAAITYGLLGFTALTARLLGAILLACAVGMACPNPPNPKSTPGAATICHATPSPTTTTIFQELVSTCLQTAVEIYPTVLFGLALSTAALHYLPSLTTYTASGGHGWLLLAAAMPLQLCEHTSVALAGAVRTAGGSPGLAFALLLSAPATNMPTFFFVWQRAGLGAAVRTAVVLLATAWLLSWAVDTVPTLDLLADKKAGEMAQLPQWWTLGSPYLAGIMLVLGYGQELRKGASTARDCCSPPEAVGKSKKE